LLECAAGTYGTLSMKVVTGVIGNDIHVVANRLMDLSLNARGYEVFNLGVNTYLEEFFDAAVETGAGFDLVCHQVDLNTGLDMLEHYMQEKTH